MKKRFIVLILCLLLLSPVAISAQELEEPLVLGLSKDFGYAAAGQIQGSFSLKVRSPDDLVRVEFYIDDQLVHSATPPPFQFKFNTAEYSFGEHTFSAVGFRSDNSMLSSSEFSRQFISADDAWKNVGKLVVPVFVLVGIVALLGISGGVLIGRQKNFKFREYGIAGGAVCPRCRFPYTRNLLAPNMLVGKLQRCPHCGKWSIVARASANDLEVAEVSYRKQSVGEVILEEQNSDYNKLLDDSRFERRITNYVQQKTG
jgi:hypothetical protein